MGPLFPLLRGVASSATRAPTKRASCRVLQLSSGTYMISVWIVCLKTSPVLTVSLAADQDQGWGSAAHNVTLWAHLPLQDAQSSRNSQPRCSFAPCVQLQLDVITRDTYQRRIQHHRLQRQPHRCVIWPSPSKCGVRAARTSTR